MPGRPDTRQEVLWILRAQSGDRHALELLLRAIEAPLREYLRALVGASDADDLVQDVLFVIYRKLSWLQSPEVFRPWMFRIASRRAMRHLKKTRRWQEDISTTELNTIPAIDVAALPRLTELLSTMNGLSPASRSVLVLHFQHELSLPEVAAVLRIPLGTAKSRLAYGLAALRKQLGHSRSSYE